MADVENAVRTRLTAHAGTTALIGTHAYYGALPQHPPLPAATVQQISGPRISAMLADVDKVEGRIQVMACDSSRAGAKALAEQIRAALQRYSGTSAGTVLHDCFLVNEMPGYESETKLFTMRQDYMVWWSE